MPKGWHYVDVVDLRADGESAVETDYADPPDVRQREDPLRPLHGTPGSGRELRPLVGIDVHLLVEHPAAELQELGAPSLASPAIQAGLADAPAGGQLFLIVVSD